MRNVLLALLLFVLAACTSQGQSLTPPITSMPAATSNPFGAFSAIQAVPEAETPNAPAVASPSPSPSPTPATTDTPDDTSNS